MVGRWGFGDAAHLAHTPWPRSRVRDRAAGWLVTEDAGEVSRDPDAPPDVRPKARRGGPYCNQGRLASRGTATAAAEIVWVGSFSIDGIVRLVEHARLWH